MHCLYVIENSVNGKRYIGRTKQARIRWRQHIRAARRGEGPALHAAIRKYGEAAFNFRVLLEDLTDAEVRALERFYVVEFETHADRHGYNRTDGGDGVAGLTFSDETRRKMAERLKGKPGIGRGVKRSEASRRRISEGHRGIAHTPQQRAKISAALMGRVVSNETRAKIGAANKRNWARPDDPRRLKPWPAQKLNSADIATSRRWHERGIPLEIIAAHFDVHRETIRRHLRRK